MKKHNETPLVKKSKEEVQQEEIGRSMRMMFIETTKQRIAEITSNLAACTCQGEWHRNYLLSELADEKKQLSKIERGESL